MFVEIDFLKRSAKCSRLETIRYKMNIRNSVSNYMSYKQLNWHSLVRRINEERLPQKVVEWLPPARIRKGRPRNLLMQEVTSGMREKGINNGSIGKNKGK